MSAPQPSFRYPTRTKVLVAAVVALAIAGFAWAGMRADTDISDEVTLSGGPGQSRDSRGVLAVSPGNGSEALTQDAVSIKLADTWTGELTFLPGNGAAVPLPQDEIQVTALNELIYVPGEGKALERLPEGTTSCVVAVIWDRVEGREATERSEQWCFSVT